MSESVTVTVKEIKHADIEGLKKTIEIIIDGKPQKFQFVNDKDGYVRLSIDFDKRWIESIDAKLVSEIIYSVSPITHADEFDAHVRIWFKKDYDEFIDLEIDMHDTDPIQSFLTNYCLIEEEINLTIDFEKRQVRVGNVIFQDPLRLKN